MTVLNDYLDFHFILIPILLKPKVNTKNAPISKAPLNCLRLCSNYHRQEHSPIPDMKSRNAAVTVFQFSFILG